MVRRVYVEKKETLRQEAAGLLNELRSLLGITAMAPTLKEALADAYAAAETVNFDGKYMRHDIGRRALAAMEEQ